jgi:hypothetical protein
MKKNFKFTHVFAAVLLTCFTIPQSAFAATAELGITARVISCATPEESRVMCESESLCCDRVGEVIELNTAEVQEKILAEYADSKKWCGPKPTMPKKGQIVIFWSRDKNGRCVVPNYIEGR